MVRVCAMYGRPAMKLFDLEQLKQTLTLWFGRTDRYTHTHRQTDTSNIKTQLFLIIFIFFLYNLLFVKNIDHEITKIDKPENLPIIILLCANFGQNMLRNVGGVAFTRNCGRAYGIMTTIPSAKLPRGKQLLFKFLTFEHIFIFISFYFPIFFPRFPREMTFFSIINS
jgi:hypothetical protein